MSQPNSIPLTEDEQSLLRDILKVRSRFLFTAIAGISIVYFLMILRPFLSDLIHEDISDIKSIKEVLLGPLIIALFLAVPFIIGGIFIYKNRIWPYYADIKNGVKNAVHFEIIDKQYFPMVGQYYISLNNPNYLFHEVDEVWYNSCQIGDNAVIFQAPKSKYYFQLYPHFTLV